ncbi:hypothetical protein DUNSADRAFT_5718 [Dunaliella salina]|uniref:Encoded protein n=1 Tax=Dunaliella salina TaxID=3046 RepID=A0ABQ7FU51_DUNSA|nr:hypothetical protein DUNSADRAFT_5718 [Dunaliella salina]|eukprot:KAF5825948.1 hypothetical protein DUNSADRAFT_5718 [Dunaliella salina]
MLSDEQLWQRHLHRVANFDVAKWKDEGVEVGGSGKHPGVGQGASSRKVQRTEVTASSRGKSPVSRIGGGGSMSSRSSDVDQFQRGRAWFDGGGICT